MLLEDAGALTKLRDCRVPRAALRNGNFQDLLRGRRIAQRRERGEQAKSQSVAMHVLWSFFPGACTTARLRFKRG